MQDKFRTIDGRTVDLIAHLHAQYNEHPDLTLHVGTDSQNTAGNTVYATVIAFRYPNKGVHCLISKHLVPRIRDKWQRLYHEAELSVEVANWINDNTPYKVHCIDLDYNNDPMHFSNSVVSAGAGLAQGFGYKFSIKPSEQIAARAADNFCNS